MRLPGIGAEVVPFVALGAALLLLGLSAWDDASIRRRRSSGRESGVLSRGGRTGDPATRTLEGHLAAWMVLAVLFWARASRAGDSAPMGTSWLWFSAGLGLAAILAGAGWLLGRSSRFPSGLRWCLAPYQGLSMWLLWLRGLVSRRPGRKDPAPAAGGAGFPEAASSRALEGVRELASLSLDELMVPRSQLSALEGDLTVGEAVAEVARAPHALYPVHGETVDHSLGVVRILDLAEPGILEDPVRRLVRPAEVVPETMPGLSLLSRLCRAPIPAALVVDEFGGMAGLVTVEDLVEVLVGELAGEHEVVRTRIHPLGSGRYRVEGTCTVEEFNRFFGSLLPEGDYETVAGYFISQVGVIPQVGEVVTSPRVTLEVLERTERRILALSVVVTGEREAFRTGAHLPRSASVPPG